MRTFAPTLFSVQAFARRAGDRKVQHRSAGLDALRRLDIVCATGEPRLLFHCADSSALQAAAIPACLKFQARIYRRYKPAFRS